MTQSEKNSKRWMIKVSLIIALMILSMLMLEKPESTKERERARDYLAENVPDDILNISFRKRCIVELVILSCGFNERREK